MLRQRGPLQRKIRDALLRGLGVFALVAAIVNVAYAEEPESKPGDVPPLDELAMQADAKALWGQRVVRIEVVVEGEAGSAAPSLRRVRVGEPLSVEMSQRAIGELTDTGAFSSVRAEALPAATGVVLRLVAVRRYVVERVRVQGGRLDPDQTLRAVSLRQGQELSADDVPQLETDIATYYSRHGYPDARVRVETLDTDDPLRVVLVVHVDAGEALRVGRLRFEISPDPQDATVLALVRRYALSPGDRADEERLDEADHELEQRLRARGWHRARIDHVVRAIPGTGLAHLTVKVSADAFMEIRFEGNRTFDATRLRQVLDLEKAEDRSPLTLVQRLREHYVRHGFFDVQVEVEENASTDDTIHELFFSIRENGRVRVAAREYPCLSGDRTPREVGQEIDSYLAEELPGKRIFSSVDPGAVDALYGPSAGAGSRVAPPSFNPWDTYAPAVYDRARKHLQDLYRAEGYLSATVGPVRVVRRQCQPRSPPGTCIPIGPRESPPAVCRYDEIGVPMREPKLDAKWTCRPDSTHGVKCEPDLVLVIPIKLGPRSILYDIRFAGNEALSEQRLAEIARVPLGQPVSQPELDRATRRLIEAYAEDGFAFAAVKTDLDLSPDRTRARVTFMISESDRVRVGDIVIRGASNTNEGVIRRRIVLRRGGTYRRSAVRKTEERLALLGVFSSVTVGLESPYVPAKEKVVIVTVQEREPQYLDIKGGVSSGEGPRGALEYGHRNLGGSAVQFRLRAALNYLPDFLILEQDVRAKFVELQRDRGLGARLERQISATVEFPDIGLGPLFRLGVEGLSVRDNSRDFGISKNAGLVTLIYRPTSRFSGQLGPSIELNEAGIFGEQEKGALQAYLVTNPGRRSLFRVPEGETVAFAQQVSATWDGRNNPLGATRGSFASARIEHVRATPTDQLEELFQLAAVPGQSKEADVFDAIVSDFVRISNRVAGYVPFGDRGLSLALSVGWGVNVQTFSGSQTYPDRLFTLGGVDSMRGFLQDSVVPEDIARRVLDKSSGLSIEQVVVRGGDFFINPRSELRIPLGVPNVQTAVFLDTGNLWASAANLRASDILDPRNLRYSVGSGLRVSTPIGPLVFDYGFNLQRVLDRLDETRKRQRFWEDLGAFHFSIGVF